MDNMAESSNRMENKHDDTSYQGTGLKQQQTNQYVKGRE